MESLFIEIEGECLILTVAWSLKYCIECPMPALVFLIKECVTF